MDEERSAANADNGRHPDKTLRPDADRGREPKLVAGHSGRRTFSLAALVERIESAFLEEYGLDSPALLEADTSAKRLKLVLETTNYVLAVEAVSLSTEEKAALVQQAYSHIFGYGPLDPLLADDRITTISLEGADRVAVRYGHGDLTTLPPIFHNLEHLRRTFKRLLIDGQAELRDDLPFVEFGLTIGDRPACISLAAPPAAFQLSADIRLHPRRLLTPDDLEGCGFLNPMAVRLLRALAQSEHGVIVVGEPESGKTTLLSLLAGWLPQPERVVTVERAGELRLPADIRRYVVQWPFRDRTGVSFTQQVLSALDVQPACILLDEVRADEPAAVEPLLSRDSGPRQLWAFRGTTFTKRLASALGMLARRADVARGDALAQALYQRLPFVVTVSRVHHQLRLWGVGEWQVRDGYPAYVPLMEMVDGTLRLTRERPDRHLPIEESFWTTA